MNVEMKVSVRISVCCMWNNVRFSEYWSIWVYKVVCIAVTVFKWAWVSQSLMKWKWMLRWTGNESEWRDAFESRRDLLKWALQYAREWLHKQMSNYCSKSGWVVGWVNAGIGSEACIVLLLDLWVLQLSNAIDDTITEGWMRMTEVNVRLSEYQIQRRCGEWIECNIELK